MSEVRELRAVAEEAMDAGARWLAAAGEEWARTRFKPSGEEVTDADVEVERRVTRVLRQRTPGIPVIGEESSGKGPLPPRCWLLDPIDGTMNFTRGAPGHALSLAYVADGTPSLGVVHAPALGRRWSTGTTRLAATGSSGAVELSHAVVGLTGVGSGRTRAGRFIGRLYDEAYRIRLQGAMSLDLVGVSEGWLDACVCIGPKPWDVAAGTALVRERGKAVLGLDGGEFGFGSPVLAAGSEPLARGLMSVWRSIASEEGRT
ncbi:inositol monophosphatase family protein [Streptomyces sp. NPDC058620]|uniref:inositol monophosphatase family protein n=1 Tax=Streptomyces sp. NPDC058620 TaxID=3346560 RepID=UPI00364D8854